MGIQTVGQKQSDESKATLKIAQLERVGDKLVIPTGMSLADAAANIKRAMEAEEMVVNLSEEFDGFVWDGAWAMKLALEERYGWVDIQPTPGFFGDEPPSLIGIKIDSEGKTVQVPWGKFLCPAIPKKDGFFASGFSETQGGQVIFKLTGTMKQKYKDEFQALCSLIRKHIRENSLYRGKAISVKFKGADGKALKLPEPKFLQLRDDPVVFSKEVEDAVRTSLFTPIEHTAAVRTAGIPLKRGILLAGDYGTGKTLVAFVSAAKAVRNGWTFIYCENINEFTEVMRFAQSYGPAIVFCEDIDKVLEGQRSISMDQVLNVMDGVDSKRNEIMVILTTNDVEKIHPAALRPGRLDAVIHVKRPDSLAVQNLIRLYAGSLLDPEEDLSVAGEILAGQIPAVVREAVERSKLAEIGLSGRSNKLSAQAIAISADGMRMQLDLLEQKRKVEPTEMQLFGHALGQHIKEGVEFAFDAACTPNGPKVKAHLAESHIHHQAEVASHANGNGEKVEAHKKVTR